MGFNSAFEGLNSSQNV